jgi:hypothetical protein
MLTGFGSNFSGLEGALIGLAVLVFFIVRQFSTRRVLSTWTVIPPLVLAYFGLQGLSQLDSTGWLLLGLSLSLGVALGFVRGNTFRISTGAQGEALMRGTALTLVWWLITIAVKAGLTFAEARFGFGAMIGNNAEIMLPAAATIAAQSLVVYLRAQDRQATTPAPSAWNADLS